MGIDAAIYTDYYPTQPELVHSPMEQPHDFISLLTFPSNPYTFSRNPLALNVCNNKEDNMTQSQMFKAEDASKLIDCQAVEIDGFHKFDVMDACPVSSLPPHVDY